MEPTTQTPRVLETVAPRGTIPDVPNDLDGVVVFGGSGLLVPVPQATADQVERYLQWRETWASVQQLAFGNDLAIMFEPADSAGQAVVGLLRVDAAQRDWQWLSLSEVTELGAALVDARDKLDVLGLRANVGTMRALNKSIAAGIAAGGLHIGPMVFVPRRTRSGS
jgi:hypothetical protein